MFSRIVRGSILLSLLSVGAVDAQITARLSGVVRDQQGGVVPNAEITVTNEATGLKRAATASAAGEYMLLELPAGAYSLDATAPGFAKLTQSGIRLSVNQSARNDLTLSLGGVAQEVVVRADASMVDTSSSELKQTVDTARMTEIPLAGRNVLALATLMPGVVTTSMPNGVGGSGTQTRMFINGNRYSHNNFQLDGADFTGTAYAGQPGRYPSPDAVQEFTILTNAFNAQFGQGAAVINAVTRSGTNEFHGALWEFVRNDDFNARNFFGGPTTNKYQYNQFGGAVGGPILRNRTFFFANYEGLRGRIGSNPSASTVPNAALRGGDLSSVTRRVVDPTTGQAFPGNRIPTERLDPVAQRVLQNFVPLPNSAGDRYVYAFPNQEDYDQFMFRVDHSFSATSRLSVRGLASFGLNSSAYSPFPGFESSIDTDPKNLTVSHSHAFSPTKLNEFRATVQRVMNPSLRLLTVGESAAALGFKTNPVPATTVFPETRISNYFNMGSRNGDITTLENKWVAQDTFSMVTGAHVIKLGGEFKRSRFAQWGEYGTRGRFTFSNDLSGSSIVNFLLGLPSSYNQRSPLNFSNSNYTFAGFVQDDWKVTPRLTLNLGFRYEFHAPPAERENKLAFWVPETFQTGQRSVVFPNAPLGMLYAGDPGMPERGGVNRYGTLGVLGPRVGFALDLFGNARSTFRGAYGIFNIPMDMQMVANSSQMPPFDMIVTQTTPPSYADPFRGRVDPFPSWQPKTQYNLAPLYPMEVYPNNLAYRNGYSQQWNATFEHQVLRDLSAQVSYTGMRGLHLWYWPQINAARYAPGATVNNTDARRPYAPYYAGIFQFGSDASRTSNSLQFVVRKRYSQGLTITGSFVLSNTMSWWDDGHQGFSQDPNNAFADYARADTDVNQRAVISWVYDFPKWTNSRVAGLAINGWQFTGASTMQAGFPFNVVTGADNSLTGNGWDRPDVAGDWRIEGDRSKESMIRQYFNTAAFRANKTGTFGNLGRNALRGPGLVNVDMGLFKNFHITEHHRFQFRAEAFNALNRANFNNPDASLASPTYGQILSSGPARILQFGLKFLF